MVGRGAFMALDKSKRAKEVFQMICFSLENRNWKYNKKESELMVSFSVVGKDLPMHLKIYVEADREIVTCYTSQDFTVPKEKVPAFCMGICAINNHLIDGSFDFDILRRVVTYRLTASYHDAVLGSELIQYIFDCSTATVDDVNVEMKAFAEGKLDYDKFIQKMLS